MYCVVYIVVNTFLFRRRLNSRWLAYFSTGNSLSGFLLKVKKGCNYPDGFLL